jgi:hypothetical protein
MVLKAAPSLVALLAIVSGLAWGCGDDGSDGAGGAGGSSNGGTSGSGGRAGSAGRSGAGGSGGSGASSVDAGSDAAPDSGGSGGSGNPLPPGCPEPSPEPVTGQVVSIQSINFNTSEVVLRNVSSSAQTITLGRTGWQWCNYPNYWNLEERDDVSLEPGKTFAFIANNNQSGPVELYADGGEMAIYTKTGTFTNADEMVAYVAWGDIEAVREPTASMADLWRFGERVAMRPTDAGLLATGPTDRGVGYTGVRAACLVAPPNPP